MTADDRALIEELRAVIQYGYDPDTTLGGMAATRIESLSAENAALHEDRDAYKSAAETYKRSRDASDERAAALHERLRQVQDWRSAQLGYAGAGGLMFELDDILDAPLPDTGEGETCRECHMRGWHKLQCGTGRAEQSDTGKDQAK